MTQGWVGEMKQALTLQFLPIHWPTNPFCDLMEKPQTAPRDTERVTGDFLTQRLQ